MSGNKPVTQPPGAGLPRLEQAFLSTTFKCATAVLSDRRAMALFNKETDRLLRFAKDDESYDISAPLLIPRVIGIEDSSRNWSVLMVLEHLCMVNSDILTAIGLLLNGESPEYVLATKDYKPSPDAGYDVIQKFEQVNSDYVGNVESLIQSRGSLRSSARYEHPWFGPLDAHQWHCLAAIHQRIHRRQTQKIVAMLGVT